MNAIVTGRSGGPSFCCIFSCSCVLVATWPSVWNCLSLNDVYPITVHFLVSISVTMIPRFPRNAAPDDGACAIAYHIFDHDRPTVASAYKNSHRLSRRRRKAATFSANTRMCLSRSSHDSMIWSAGRTLTDSRRLGFGVAAGRRRRGHRSWVHPFPPRPARPRIRRRTRRGSRPRTRRRSHLRSLRYTGGRTAGGSRCRGTVRAGGTARVLPSNAAVAAE